MPEYYEIEDGDDTLNWIAAQDFSDGQVSMTGGSYLGYVQWAAAASGNPHLKAMLSSVCAGSAFVDIPRRGGCFNSGMLAWAFAMSEQKMRPDLMAQENWDEILDIRPLEDIPRKALGHEVPFITKWLSHMDMDDFWKHGNWFERYQGKPVPALIMSGWFDDNGMGTTEALDLVKTWPKGTWKAVLGPWKHSGNADYDLHGVSLGEDALRYDMDILCMMWLEHFLKGVENGIENTSTVEYYTVGENQWKQAATWPVENVTRTMYYLDGEGNNLADGVISAKYRNGFEIPEYMEPGKIYEINIRTTKISNTFLPGHRMRVTITSSAKNFIFPNSNTENGFNSEKRQKAHITVHRGGKYTSGILIPVENK